jgi:hypothetical protein
MRSCKANKCIPDRHRDNFPRTIELRLSFLLFFSGEIDTAFAAARRRKGPTGPAGIWTFLLICLVSGQIYVFPLLRSSFSSFFSCFSHSAIARATPLPQGCPRHRSSLGSQSTRQPFREGFKRIDLSIFISLKDFKFLKSKQ